MIKEVVDAGGIAFLVPAVLLALLAAGIKAAFGVFGRRSQTRREFLEHWNAARVGDDIWLEVTARHLVGAYMPAHVIRLALAEPHKMQALLDVANIWPLLVFDSNTQQVTWKHRRHRTLRGRKLAHRLISVGYFAFAFAAILAGWACSKYEPNTFSAWMYGVLAVEGLVLAFICLERDETYQTAAQMGDEWVSRINFPSMSSGRPMVDLHSNPSAASTPNRAVVEAAPKSE